MKARLLLPQPISFKRKGTSIHLDQKAFLFGGRRRLELDRIVGRRLLNENGGGDRTRTCKPARAAVFKTAALPIMLPLRLMGGNYNLGRSGAQLAVGRIVKSGQRRRHYSL